MLMIRGNNSDFIYHPLPNDSVSVHGASHHAWAPWPPPSKSGAETTTAHWNQINSQFVISTIFVECIALLFSQ